MKDKTITTIIIVLAVLYFAFHFGYTKEAVVKAYKDGYEDAKIEYEHICETRYEEGYKEGHSDGYNDAERDYELEQEFFTVRCPNCGIYLDVDRLYEGYIDDYYWKPN